MVSATSRTRGGRRLTLNAVPGGATVRNNARAPAVDMPELSALFEQVERAILWAHDADQPVEVSFLIARGQPGARITAKFSGEHFLPAADLHAEQNLLGLLLYDNSAFHFVPRLERAHFWVPFHGRLFSQMANLVTQGKLAEPILLDKHFASDPEYGALGGLRYLADLVSDAPDTASVAELADRVRDLSIQRPDVGVAEATASDDLQVALGEARARGAKRAAEILAEPTMLGADAFAGLIGATRETVRQRLQKREVLGLQGAKRGIRYPAWQVLHDGKLLPGLPELFGRLGDNAWTVFRFLTQPNSVLAGATPLDRLRVGDSEAVLAAAETQARGDFN